MLWEIYVSTLHWFLVLSSRWCDQAAVVGSMHLCKTFAQPDTLTGNCLRALSAAEVGSSHCKQVHLRLQWKEDEQDVSSSRTSFALEVGTSRA